MVEDISPIVDRGWGDTQEERKQSSVLWYHVAASEVAHMIILSSTPVRYRGHWFLGRMSPCTGDSCPFCSKRLGAQVRYCFSVFVPRENRQCLFEIGAYTAGVVKDLAQLYGGLVGLHLSFYKSGGRQRGRIECEKCSIPYDQRLPEAQDVASILEGGWREQSEKLEALRPLP